MPIKINNSAEDAVGGAWSSVNLTALRNRLATAVEEGESGARDVVRECYAVVDGFDAPSTDWHYPHHSLSGDELLVHMGGVQAATQRASQQNATAAMNHLRKHARALRAAGRIEESVLLSAKEIRLEQPEWAAMKADAPPAAAGQGVMVALYPDATVAEALALPDGIPAGDLHVTLAYLGKTYEIDRRTLDALPHIVRRWAEWELEKEGQISGVGRFTAIDPHAFYVSVYSTYLGSCRDSLVADLHRAGVPVVEDHGFIPHITLAYLAPDAPDPIDTITAHRLRFGAVTLAIGAERHTFPLQPAAEDLAAKGAVLTGPIVRKDARQQIAYGAVLVPGEADTEDDVLSAEKIEEVAHEWMATYRNIDLQHSLSNIDAVPVESFLEPEDRDVTLLDGTRVHLPKGTWTMAAKVRSPETWREIEAGERTGFSIMGLPADALASALSAVKAGTKAQFPQFIRVTLTELGGGDPNGPWVAPFVSIVDEPSVLKAKFYALKAAPEEKKGPIRRLFSKRTDKERSPNKEDEDMERDEIVQIVAETIKAQLPGALKAAQAAPGDGGELSDATTTAIKEAVSEAIKPVAESVEKLEQSEERQSAEERRAATKAALTEAVTAAVKEATEQEEVPEGMTAAVEGAVERALATSDENAEVSDATTAAIKEAVSEAIKPVSEKLDRVEERTRATSRQPDDTAPAAPKSADFERDAFGRRVFAG